MQWPVSWFNEVSMKMRLTQVLTLIALLTLSFVATATDEKKAAKAKPYPLKTCVVSDEKFGGDMGDPYIFTYQGREVKLCCKSCLKDFNKEPAKYLKKMDAGEKK
jgi:hypothetical protein